MSYIGNTVQNQNYVPAIDYFNGNGSTVAFTLSRPVASVAAVQAVINNVQQNPGDAFTVLNNTITFTSAPPSGTNNIYVYYTSPNTQIVQPGQGTVYPSSLSTGGPYWSSTSNFGIGKTSYGSMTTDGVWFSISDKYNQISTTSNVDATLYLNQNGTGDIQQWRVANAVKATLNTYGFGLGNATPSSGTGITFPATQSASSDANTLDDYEEGTFNWGVSFGGGTTGITYTMRNGYYVKIGRNVTVCGIMYLSNKGSSTGNAAITGLPFAVSNQTNCYIGYNGYTESITLSSGTIQLGWGGGATDGFVFNLATNGAISNLTNTAFNNNTQMRFALSYITD